MYIHYVLRISIANSSIYLLIVFTMPNENIRVTLSILAPGFLPEVKTISITKTIPALEVAKHSIKF